MDATTALASAPAGSLGSPAPELARHHARARGRGVNRPLYWLVRALLQPFFHVYFRLGRTGRHHVPERGPVILASNHRSFCDPFLIGTLLRRPIYYMAKQELFRHRLIAWTLGALGAFPICRGESDDEAMATARTILERGDGLLIFPEGTRVRPGSLGDPRRGVGRLALETGAPVVPVALTGTEGIRRGWRIRPRRVRIRCGRPLTFPRVDSPSPRLAREVTARIWPCVELQWEWLGGMPPLRRAAVIGGGSWGTALAVLLSRAGLEVELGCRTAAQAEDVSAAGVNHRYLPDERLPDGLLVRAASEIELGTVDLVCLAVPAKALPAVLAEVGDRITPRTGVLVLSKGLVPPLGALPSSYVGERLRARAVACLGGPAHAAEAVDGRAAVVLASHDAAFRRQLTQVLGRAGLGIERSDDVVGVELAGCAKNVAAVAAAAAETHGMNAAGAAAGRIFGEVHDLARRLGGRSETFVSLAGAGDLVATAMAGASRSRRAGQLLGRGASEAEIAAGVGQATEGLDSVPLLLERLGREGVESPGVAALQGLIDGTLAGEDWGAALRAGRAREASRAA